MTQNKTLKPLLLSLCLSAMGITLANCAHQHHVAKVTSLKHADATIEQRSGNTSIKGLFHFVYENETLTLTGKVEGLRPNRAHGFHIHATGDCSAADASSAGPHFSPNPQNQHGSHADPNRHAGDLGNLTSDKNGVANVNVTLPGLNLSEDTKDFSVLGRSLVVHSDPDDFVSQPAGNSGARIGCALIKKANH